MDARTSPLLVPAPAPVVVDGPSGSVGRAGREV